MLLWRRVLGIRCVSIYLFLEGVPRYLGQILGILRQSLGKSSSVMPA